MQPDKAACNSDPEYKALICGQSKHLGAPTPATDSALNPAPESKVDPYQDPAYHQPHALIETPVVEAPKVEAAQLSPAMQTCIDECLECHKICLSEAAHQYQIADSRAGSRGGILLDCAEICRMNVNFLRTASPFHGLVCGVCATICQVCATSCDEMGLTHCAAQCRQCAAQCREMAPMAA